VRPYVENKKKGLVEWLKVKPLSSNPSTATTKNTKQKTKPDIVAHVIPTTQGERVQQRTE
jgi:hypothetical protein